MKRLLAGLLVAAAAITTHTVSSQAAEPTVVLVHGAFADGSSWSKVIPLLRDTGLNVVAVQNPLSSLEADVDATKRVIDQIEGPVVLVGHSWGGVVITEAGNDPKVESLVYVAAFAPDNGESIASMTADAPPPPYAPYLQKDEGGYLTLTAEGVQKQFAQDLSSDEADLVAITQGPWSQSCVSAKVSHAAWRDKPSWTVIAEDDHMIPSSLQETMAKRINATVTKVAASHVVMLSKPKEVAETILAAAASVH
ncbi:alpha/beta fold hydrolase [Roseibium sp. M-1]